MYLDNFQSLFPLTEVRTMKNTLEVANEHNDKGQPAGGFVVGPGLNIEWQNGPTPRVKGQLMDPPERTRGAFIEDVLEAARRRLQFYQDSPWACNENANALQHIEMAIADLESREKRRIAQGIAGTNELDPRPAPAPAAIAHEAAKPEIGKTSTGKDYAVRRLP